MTDDARNYWTLEEIMRVAADEGIVLDFSRITLSSIQSSRLSRGALVEGLRMLAAMPSEEG